MRWSRGRLPAAPPHWSHVVAGAEKRVRRYGESRPHVGYMLATCRLHLAHKCGRSSASPWSQDTATGPLLHSDNKPDLRHKSAGKRLHRRNLPSSRASLAPPSTPRAASRMASGSPPRPCRPAAPARRSAVSGGAVRGPARLGTGRTRHCRTPSHRSVIETHWPLAHRNSCSDDTRHEAPGLALSSAPTGRLRDGSENAPRAVPITRRRLAAANPAGRPRPCLASGTVAWAWRPNGS